MKTLDLHHQYHETIKVFKEVFRQKGLIVYPTDTLYGIGGDATCVEVVERIYAIKKRPKHKPLSVIVGNLEQLLTIAEVNEEEMNWIHAHLPGPYTVLLQLSEKGKEMFKWLTTPKIGVRVPQSAFLRTVLADINGYLIGTSANVSGEKPPTHHQDVAKAILKDVDLFIKAGATLYKKPSIIVDVREKKKWVR